MLFFSYFQFVPKKSKKKFFREIPKISWNQIQDYFYLVKFSSSPKSINVSWSISICFKTSSAGFSLESLSSSIWKFWKKVLFLDFGLYFGYAAMMKSMSKISLYISWFLHDFIPTLIGEEKSIQKYSKLLIIQSQIEFVFGNSRRNENWKIQLFALFL